ncbi:leucine rich repeat containing protein kinase, putative [Ricinus communis]|uniref:Leucine rich repeat containing protein kinase, putative n=1 Tax=Ricinus communis TaxID=3988 RepID=B9SCX3_RICCO|nr:leucine rich repeat containing protein kinase, putative [Ricinus communis]
MLDVALPLEYLHHGQLELIVHCDLKPNNVLLDEAMVAHVGDFGIAKILEKRNITMQTRTLSTFGYIAPVHAKELTFFFHLLSTALKEEFQQTDVYNYGIVLLEKLRQWVHEAFPDNIVQVVDSNLLMERDGTSMETGDHLLALCGIGQNCSRELPRERSDIKDVKFKLTKIKIKLQLSRC